MTPTVLVSLAVVHSAPVMIDVPRLVGEWRGEGPFGRGTLVFTPNGACVEKSAGRLRAATYRVDPWKRPAEIDFWDPRAEAPRRGIYKISGDNLTVSWAEDRGDPRPARLDAPGVELLHLTRAARTAPPAGERELARLAPWANKLFTGSWEAPPPVIVRDAGVLPKGQTTTVRVTMTNVYAVKMRVPLPKPVSQRVPCAVVRWPDRLDPKQAGLIEVAIDTRGLDGECAVRVPVTVWGADPGTGGPASDPGSGRQYTSQAEVVIRFLTR